jgi:hypothetical protein
MNFKQYRDKSKGKKNASKLSPSISKMILNKKKDEDNLKDDYTSNISNIDKKNQDILGSIIFMQEELEKERMKTNSPFSKKNISKIVVEVGDDDDIKDEIKKKVTKSKIAEGFNMNNTFIEGKELSKIGSVIRDPINRQNNDLLKKMNENKDNIYLNESQLILLIITLKKTLIHYQEKNKELKEEKNGFLDRAKNLTKNINIAENAIAKLEREKRLSDRVVYNLEFDLNDLDQKFSVMDQNIKDSTGDNSQETFIIETIEMKEKLRKDMEQNNKNLGELKNNLVNINEALIKLNDQ